ncbi:MAG TPA: hypothetical protein VMF04_06535 [Thermoplasmata archaeon]|nr:hypothetical protein [Thermoplasmata archaeon]
MNGRWVTVLLLWVVPAVAIGATVAWFNSNPLAIMIALSAMILGALYLLTYSERFGAAG